MGKRGNNEGSIYKRKDGRWTAVLSLPGRKRRYLYGKTRDDVAHKLTSAMRDKDAGIPVTPQRQTVAQFLRQWMETSRSSVRRTTYIRYEEYIRLHAVPEIGDIRLSRLTPQHFQSLYSKKLNEGLSPTSVHHLHAVLHRAFGRAVRWQLLVRSPTDSVDPPRRETFQVQPLDPQQARRFLAVAHGDRLYALYVLALTTGMRQGELLALKWRNVDLDQGKIYIRETLQPGGIVGEPKTLKGRRQIVLAPMAAEALYIHRLVQLSERQEVKTTWQNHDLVFCNRVGSFIDPNNLRHRSFNLLLSNAGLPRIRFHDLRHTTATLLLSQGTHPKVVQELLGHSQISVTMDTYSHVLPTLQRDAMATMNSLLMAD